MSSESQKIQVWQPLAPLAKKRKHFLRLTRKKDALRIYHQISAYTFACQF